MARTIIVTPSEAQGDVISTYPDYASYGEYGWLMERIRAFKDKSKIIAAFKSVWGRKPTDTEILTVATAYEKNKDIWGDRLKDRKFVAWVQSAINAVLGKPVVKVDGIFGYQTISGIMKAQAVRGLKVNGILDQATFALLRSAKEDVAITTGKPDLFASHKSSHLWLMVAGGVAVAALLAYILLKRE